MPRPSRSRSDLLAPRYASTLRPIPAHDLRTHSANKPAFSNSLPTRAPWSRRRSAYCCAAAMRSGVEAGEEDAEGERSESSARASAVERRRRRVYQSVCARASERGGRKRVSGGFEERRRRRSEGEGETHALRDAAARFCEVLGDVGDVREVRGWVGHGEGRERVREVGALWCREEGESLRARAPGSARSLDHE